MRARLRIVPLLVAVLSSSAPPANAVDGPRGFLDVAPAAGIDFSHFNGMSGRLYFAEMTGAGGALLDYDGDGDLDLYAVQGTMLGDDLSVEDATLPPLHPLPLTDRLYRNDSVVGADGTLELRFVDVTSDVGLQPKVYGMGAAVGDYDNDGDPDLYLTNLGSNQLLRNRGDGTFEDVTDTAGVADRRWSVPAAFLDYDEDGWLDLFVGNYVDFRVATHKPCATATGAFDYCGPLAYRPEVDRLFHNRGDGTFEDVSAAAGIDQAYGGALGVVTADFDGDGRVDVYVANDGVPNQLWTNQGDGTFVDDALLSGSAVNEEGQPEASMGVVVGDVDADGDEDLFMAHLTRETNTLYLNDGTGFFRDASRASGLGGPSWGFTGFGTALFDYDIDGWLDLIVANGAVKHVEELVRRGDPYPLHQTNQLFHNLGQGRFEDATPTAGEAFEQSEVSRGIAVGDVDLDGDPDLALFNNAGPARLLRNGFGDSSGRSWLGVRVIDPGRGGRDVLGATVKARAGGRSVAGRVATDGSYASAGEARVLLGLGDTEGPVELLVSAPGGDLILRAVPLDRTLVVPRGSTAK